MLQGAIRVIVGQNSIKQITPLRTKPRSLISNLTVWPFSLPSCHILTRFDLTAQNGEDAFFLLGCRWNTKGDDDDS